MNASKSERYEEGLSVRRRTLGEDYVNAALNAASDFTRPFQEFVTEYAWGNVWAQPGLEPRERSLVTVAILAAMNQHDELKLHLQAARRNGCTPEEIQATLFHVAAYAGLPSAVNAFKIAQQVLSEPAASSGKT
jgi:4-carboxymuconolactone decarboxylase